jgi:oxalate decarboxylase
MLFRLEQFPVKWAHCKTTLATRPSNGARDRTAQLDLSKPSAPTVRLHTEIVATPGGRVRIASTPQFPNLDRDRSGPGRGGSGALCEKSMGIPTLTNRSTTFPAKGGLTMFAAEASARTFDFLAGDVGYVPMSMSHFIENTGSTPLRSSNCSNPHLHGRVARAVDALTPHRLVQAHMNLDSQLVTSL